MTFPTISAGTRANEPIGGYANFIAYCNALAAGVDSVTTTAAGAALKANNLSDLASASTARTNLGLGTMATATATDYLTKAGNLTGLADLPTARTNLGLGTMATATASDYLSKAGNLDGIADQAVARTNLGLGSMATATATDYAALTGAAFMGNVSITGGSLLTQNVTALTNLGPYWTFDGTNAYSTARGAGQIPFVARLAAAHTANAIEVRNSSASVLASISAAGLGTFAGVTVSAGSDINAAHAAAGTTRYGVGAFRTAATGINNTVVGATAGDAITSGAYNVLLGHNAGGGLTTGGSNVAVGADTLTGAGSTNSVAVGIYALAGASAADNTALGAVALFGVTSGTNNIGVGSNAGRYTTTQSNELFINSINRTNRAGDIANSIVYGQQAAAAADQILTLNASVAIAGAASLGGGKGVISIANATTAPTTDPREGGILYCSGGALVFRGSSGTITTIAAA